MPRTLILSTCYVGDQPKRRLLQMWARLMTAAGLDILLIDSSSPVSTAEALPGWQAMVLDDEDEVPALSEIRRTIVSFPFPDAIGKQAPGVGNPDAGVRALGRGMEIALVSGYDAAFYVEADTLLTTPVLPMVEKCARHGVKVATAWDRMYNWCETSISYIDLRYMLAEQRFVQRYNWRSPGPGYHERKTEEMFGEDLFVLPLRGARNDTNSLTPDNLRAAFPWGCDYMTHCADFGVYRAFLSMNGREDIWGE